ncbi:MAG: SGNH/GDSL hydrolase family protein [Planctomycetes bacterium]|nr:SGNH/GDSL hydrolase family protein [Planctomycetota bacterium]
MNLLRLSRVLLAISFFTVLAVDPVRATADDQPITAEGLRFTIPPRIYAVVGRPVVVYVDNVILTQTPENFALKVDRLDGDKSVAIGTAEAQSWSLTPELNQIGRHRLRFRLYKREKPTEIAAATTELVVAKPDAGSGQELSLLIVGDSLTHASQYPNSLARLLSQPGNPTWSMLGTHRPAAVVDGVAHEGYGGWTWERFVKHFVPNSEGAEAKLRGSPFVFADDQGKPQLDPSQYFDKRFAGKRPQMMVFLLGINDCFSAPADNLPKLDERIDVVFKHAETLLSAMKKAAPQADLAVCITPPPNSRQEAFAANYQDKYTRWGWKRIQHRLVERQIKQFTDREAERLFLVPTELNVDPLDGYPVNNGVHPNAVGYQQIADALYAWIKCRLAE